MIQAGKAFDQLGLISASSGGILSTIGSVLGVLNPVGAMAGAAVSIFTSIFGGGQNANAQVLQQIQQLSQQVQRLQADMDKQFLQVNATLNSILTTLNQNFAAINYQLGVLNGNVQDIQASLLDVQTQLNQPALNMQLYLETQDYEGWGWI